MEDAKPPAPAAAREWLFVVKRELAFAGGARALVELKTFSSEIDAKEFVEQISKQDVELLNQPAFKQALQYVGVVGCNHAIVPLRPPESRILRPMPGLIVPQN